LFHPYTKDDIDYFVNRIVKWEEDTLKVWKEKMWTGIPGGHFSQDSARVYI
jgi:hypothetical protein